MNQILDYNPNKTSGGGSSKSDKIVRVFAVLLAIFAVCLLAGGAYGIYKNNKDNKLQTEAPTQAKITIEQGETTAIIKVSHDKAIEKLIYSWDSGKESSIKGTGESYMESEIPLVAGTHTLMVKVTDVDKVETLYKKEITSANGEDKIYPEVNLEVIEGPKIRITATDETAMDFLTYRWNDGEEIRVDVSEEDNKKIQVDIDILKGKNDLLVVAVDKNNNNTTKSNSYTGVVKPEVVITIAVDKRSADVVCKHENGIKEVRLKINDEVYNIDIGEGNPTEVPFKIEEQYFAEGTNVITVTAISVDDTETEVTEEVIPDEQEQPEEPESPINIDIQNVEDSLEVASQASISTSAGIKEILLYINGEAYVVGLDEENQKEISFEITYDLLNEGDNEVTIKVTDINGEEKEETVTITR